MWQRKRRQRTKAHGGSCELDNDSAVSSENGSGKSREMNQSMSHSSLSSFLYIFIHQILPHLDLVIHITSSQWIQGCNDIRPNRPSHDSDAEDDDDAEDDVDFAVLEKVS